MGSYVVAGHVAAAALEYCLRGWKLVMRISQACISCRYASLTSIPLSQAYIFHSYASLISIYLSQVDISHRNASLTSMHLSHLS